MTVLPEGTRAPFPAVAMDVKRSALGLRIVRPDYDALATKLANEVQALGHRRVVFAGPDERWAHLRARPLAAVCRDRGVTFARVDIRDDGPVGAEARQFLREHPRPFALIAGNAEHAHPALDAIKAEGISVPEQAAVLAIGADEIEANLCHPTLTTVDHNGYAIGHQAAAVLDRMLHGDRPRRRLWLVPPGETVHRGSTEYVFDDPSLVAALRYIRDRACDGIGVEDVMDQLSISRRALEQRIRRQLGRTVHEEIMRVRLQRAMELLSRSLDPLADIAAHSGFQSSSDLCKIFKRRTGLTPHQYRRASASRQANRHRKR
jgi:LacI family transcriptional regulator